MGGGGEAPAAAPADGGAHAAKVRVFVSGCYDILHGGHVRFFEQARALGDHLTVSFASDAVLAGHKAGRRPSLPMSHKRALIGALRMVDEVVVGEGPKPGLDFEEHFLRARPQLLVATEDDKYGEAKRELCAKVGAQYVVLPKDVPEELGSPEPVSTTQILASIRAPSQCPLRVDFGGGWLDVPKLSRPGAFIVNCTISPLVSLSDWPYELCGGLGGSAAHAALNGRDAVASELGLGVGWQDPAVIRETGLCVWRSGPRPALELKLPADFLRGRMALLWTGAPHVTFELTDRARDYSLIERAGALAREAVLPPGGAAPEQQGGEEGRARALAGAVRQSYAAQLAEGMAPLPERGELARKYCGGGWGGYALYLFGRREQRDEFVRGEPGAAKSIEPYIA